MAADQRLADKGLETKVEEEVACCYAVQDKTCFFFTDAAASEIYTVLADASSMSKSEATACC